MVVQGMLFDYIMKTILIVGRMVASKQGLEPLAKLLEGHGHEVHAFLPGDRDFTDDEKKEINRILDRGVSAVVVGMASQEEIAGVEITTVRHAKKLGVPVFFYADTFSSWNKDWFAEFLLGETLFVVNDNEAVQAREKFPETRVVATGNPTWDDDFFGEFPSREEVRSELGLGEGDLAILVPFAKSVAVNVLHGNAVIKAAESVKDETDREIKVIVTQHDAESYPMDIYADLKKFATVTVLLIPKKTTPTPNLLSGMDMIVGSASGVGGRAIRRRVISVDYFSDLAKRRLKKSTGTDNWEPCEQGVSMVSYSKDHLASCIVGVPHTALWISTQRAKQEELYPKPERAGIALEKMAEAVQSALV